VREDVREERERGHNARLDRRTSFQTLKEGVRMETKALKESGGAIAKRITPSPCREICLGIWYRSKLPASRFLERGLENIPRLGERSGFRGEEKKKSTTDSQESGKWRMG